MVFLAKIGFPNPVLQTVYTKSLYEGTGSQWLLFSLIYRLKHEFCINISRPGLLVGDE